MKLRPLPASEFLTFDPAYQELLKKYGAVPVNDKLLPLWERDYDIVLLFGGRGGGKSETIADDLLDECMTENYFKCYYGRKVFDTIRGSQFADLIHCIKKNNLESLFHYSEAENSSMIITHLSTGNKFIPFGSDKADKIKSIKDPTHIWGEELDQFTFDDFKDLYPTLRTIRGANRFIGSFNTYAVFPDHWLKKTFFTDIDNDLLQGKRIRKIFCNYTDNYFIDQKEYEQTLWISAGFDEAAMREIAAGAWGSHKAKSPFIFNFNRQKHIVPGLQPIPNLPIILSFDFNIDPVTCLVGQCDGLDRVRVLDEYRLLNSDIEELCQRIRADYKGDMLLVTGDASGQNRTALKRDLNYYKEIKRILQLGMAQFKLPQFNPRIKNTRVLCNALLKNHKDFLFSDRLPYLVLDIEQTEVDAHGNIDESKDKHKGHLLACFRYFCFTFLHKFLNLSVYEQGADVHSNADKTDGG